MPLRIDRDQAVVSDGDLWARLRERDVEPEGGVPQPTGPMVLMGS